MGKNVILLASATILLASCGTYEGQGAGTGAYFGALLGSAIGGISGGPRGSDVGTLVGMAGGAIAGAAIGAAADQKKESDMEQYYAEKQRLAANRQARQNMSAGYDYELGARQDSGYDASNSGDDRIDIDFGAGSESYHSPATSHGTAKLEVRNVRFSDQNGDNQLSRGEKGEIIFEIYNGGDATAYNIEPVVTETTGNRHILVSPSILVESLGAKKGVRYTARVIADKSLKAGAAHFSVTALMDGKATCDATKFAIPTKR